MQRKRCQLRRVWRPLAPPRTPRPTNSLQLALGARQGNTSMCTLCEQLWNTWRRTSGGVRCVKHLSGGVISERWNTWRFEHLKKVTSLSREHLAWPKSDKFLAWLAVNIWPFSVGFKFLRNDLVICTIWSQFEGSVSIWGAKLFDQVRLLNRASTFWGASSRCKYP